LASEPQGGVADFFGAYLLGIDGSNAHRRKKALALEINGLQAKTTSSCEEDSNQSHGHVSTMTVASFVSNSYLIGFVAHTQFLNVISAK
jgi:hypothetical protein